MKIFYCTLLLLAAVSLANSQQYSKAVPIENGVSYMLAHYRDQVISNIQYWLNFNIPEKKEQPIAGEERIVFDLKIADQPLQIDFKHTADHIRSITVNGIKIAIKLEHEHLLIAQSCLLKGLNTIRITFIAGDRSLNRNDDYLYALFVPDRARTVFPCFDQPDLKAVFLLTLQVPAGWKALANAVKVDSSTNGGKTIFRFAKTDKLSTYLFSFTVGKYTVVKRLVGNSSMEFFHRETDSAKIKASTDSIFILHRNAIDFLQRWTGILFPFQKIGFVAIPDFQFGGMEHPGEVQYKSSLVFLDDAATKDQYIARANTISHETAHMWFGDLVTMTWFNDVWMKEVFANFMADKITGNRMEPETFELHFLQDHYPAAYSIDRTLGANSIRQPLANLQDAGSLYGNIIYHKAPIMMRQLELAVGKENFRKGVDEYLKKYAYGNASWDDLIGILSKYSPVDLYKWNRVWVNQSGRPVFDYKLNCDGNRIDDITITQQSEYGSNCFWPQEFELKLVYRDSSKVIRVSMQQAKLVLNSLAGLPKPLGILFNSNGLGYGLFPVDTALEKNTPASNNPLERASAYINLYENMLSGRYYRPVQLLKLYTAGLAKESNEMNLKLLTGYISSIYWEFIFPAERQERSTGLETQLWEAMQKQIPANNKKILFKAYQEDDYTALALTIALKNDTATTVLQQQRNRIINTERKDRLTFLMPALSPDTQVRKTFFNSLKDPVNREKEAWVVTALAYLNHPLRQSVSIEELNETLGMVEEIQKTGDVFFPQSWLGAVLTGYQSKDAYNIVQRFLRTHPDYNPKLKEKLLQAADNLFRAQTLLKPQ